MANILELQEIAASIRQLHKQAQVLYSAAQSLELRADGLVQEFSTLAKLVCFKLEQSGLMSASGNSTSMPAPDNTFLFELAAKSGVDKVEFDALANGKTRVSINGGAPFLLPPALAHLLKVLCADSGTSNDEFVPWKSHEQVQAALAERKEEQVLRHTVHAQLTRLRNKLTENGENRFLILTQPDLGIRFALKRNH